MGRTEDLSKDFAGPGSRSLLRDLPVGWVRMRSDRFHPTRTRRAGRPGRHGGEFVFGDLTTVG